MPHDVTATAAATVPNAARRASAVRGGAAMTPKLAAMAREERRNSAGVLAGVRREAVADTRHHPHLRSSEAPVQRRLLLERDELVTVTIDQQQRRRDGGVVAVAVAQWREPQRFDHRCHVAGHVL